VQLCLDLAIACGFTSPATTAEGLANKWAVYSVTDCEGNKAILLVTPQQGTLTLACVPKHMTEKQWLKQAISQVSAQLQYLLTRRQCDTYCHVQHVHDQHVGDDTAGTDRMQSGGKCINAPSDCDSYFKSHPKYFKSLICANGDVKKWANMRYHQYCVFSEKNPECKETWDDWQEIEETAAVKRADGGETDSQCRYVCRFVYYVHITDERRARF